MQGSVYIADDLDGVSKGYPFNRPLNRVYTGFPNWPPMEIFRLDANNSYFKLHSPAHRCNMH